jgi:hypothetical protein
MGYLLCEGRNMLSPTAEQAQRNAAQARRRKEIYVALKKQMPVRLTTAQQLVLDRAVNTTMRSELAWADASVSHNDAVRLDRLAAAARRQWDRLAAAHKPPPQSSTPTLAELLHG